MLYNIFYLNISDHHLNDKFQDLLARICRHLLPLRRRCFLALTFLFLYLTSLTSDWLRLLILTNDAAAVRHGQSRQPGQRGGEPRAAAQLLRPVRGVARLLPRSVRGAERDQDQAGALLLAEIRN